MQPNLLTPATQRIPTHPKSQPHTIYNLNFTITQHNPTTWPPGRREILEIHTAKLGEEGWLSECFLQHVNDIAEQTTEFSGAVSRGLIKK